ncbi:MAG: DNA-3-methyladenine glycosylase 2 family protein [Leptolyngbyaceae cyanobacterium bins.349]|nr:DNA-3-methyladenine glycosylase 2 family protein [Leptolyngbyaceae cyanobacterium bins.349]
MDYTVAIATLKAADPILATVIDQVGACQLAQSQQTGDLLASLAKAILYQQLSGKSAAAIHRRFLELYPGQCLTAIEMLETPDDVLRSVGISRQKILYLKDLAHHVQTGLPSLDVLATMDDEAIIQTLTPIKGIGRWTVQMLLIFRLHRWDVLPHDDFGIRSAIQKLYQLPELPNKKTVETYGIPWQPYRAIACWYLWRSLD